MTIEKAILNFRELIENSIRNGGNIAKTAMIRSSKPILNIHEAVKHELIRRGINLTLIYPPLNQRSPELKLAGLLKQKNQDICVIPKTLNPHSEILQDGLLQGLQDKFGQIFTEQTLTINIRSQISSIQKNFDTLFERTYAEAQNLHERCPKMVLGEVYFLAIPEYDDMEFKYNNISFKQINQKLVEKYIKSFTAITNRIDITKNFYKYESTCLLIVNFNHQIPIIYHSTQELINNGLLPSDTKVNYDILSWNNFFDKLLNIYNQRFGLGNLT